MIALTSSIRSYLTKAASWSISFQSSESDSSSLPSGPTSLTVGSSLKRGTSVSSLRQSTINAGAVHALCTRAAAASVDRSARDTELVPEDKTFSRMMRTSSGKRRTVREGACMAARGPRGRRVDRRLRARSAATVSLGFLV